MRSKVMKKPVMLTTFATPKRSINALPKGAIAAGVRNISKIGVVKSEIFRSNSSIIRIIQTCRTLNKAE